MPDALTPLTVAHARTHTSIVAAALEVHSGVRGDTSVPAREGRESTAVQTLIRPLAGSAGLPSDLRALIVKEQQPIKVMHDEKALLTVLLANIEQVARTCGGGAQHWRL